MPIDVLIENEITISLEEFKELFRQGRYDARSVDDLAESAVLLRQLSNNKSFLGDFVLSELKSNLEGQVGNAYGPHNLLLGNATDNAMMRANFWPCTEDEEYRRSPESFIYEMPHDHNFNFLTVGYWGPGYGSTYYEYEYSELDGVPGEIANLKEVEKKVLELDHIMIYRAHKDVHCQHPPKKMSVTINVMDITPGFQYHQQYVFDDEVKRIKVVNSARCSSNMYDVAAIVGGERAKELLLSISQQHDSDYSRFHALRAVVKAEPNQKEREHLIRQGIDSPSTAIRSWTERYAKKLELSY